MFVAGVWLRVYSASACNALSFLALTSINCSLLAKTLDQEVIRDICTNVINCLSVRSQIITILVYLIHPADR